MKPPLTLYSLLRALWIQLFPKVLRFSTIRTSPCAARCSIDRRIGRLDRGRETRAPSKIVDFGLCWLTITAPSQTRYKIRKLFARQVLRYIFSILGKISRGLIKKKYTSYQIDLSERKSGK